MEERKKTERKSEGKVGQIRESKKTEEKKEGVKEREEGKEKGMCEARVVQGNGGDEEKVDKVVMDWVAAKRKNTVQDAGTKAGRGGQEESTDGSDLLQGGRVEDVSITKRQS